MRRGQGSGIGEVTVLRAPLLEILKNNASRHAGLYERAITAYREQAVKELDELMARVKSGRPVPLFINLPIPEEHTKDYQRAIKMLEMHTEASITLSEEAYSRLVDDDWDWMVSFAANTMSYMGGGERD